MPELGDMPIGREVWIPGYGRAVVIGKEYYCTEIAWLEDDRPVSRQTLGDYVLCYDKGPSRHARKPAEDAGE